MGEWRERKQLSNNCGMDKCANENMQICEDPEIVYLLVCKIFKFDSVSRHLLNLVLQTLILGKLDNFLLTEQRFVSHEGPQQS